jgi:hypothetical protein
MKVTGGDNMKHTKSIFLPASIALLLLLTAGFANAAALEIESPIAQAYNVFGLNLSIVGNQTFSFIKYKIDSGTLAEACTNCSYYRSGLNLSEGNHSIYAEAFKQIVNDNFTSNETFTDSVDFSIVFPIQNNSTNQTNNQTGNATASQFSLSIIKPFQKTYFEGKNQSSATVPILVSSNMTLDRITAQSRSFVFECTNCSALVGSLNATEGDYLLTAAGYLGNVTKSRNVIFRVANFSSHEDEIGAERKNQTGPRFINGFEKLPKMFDAGQLNDSELAAIIRDNKINPGILNKLIKTGKLGNESISAILDTQFKPKGILNKILSFIGLGDKSFSEMIYNSYNLTPSLEKKIVLRDDLPKHDAEKIREKLQKEIKEKVHAPDKEDERLNSKDDRGNSTGENLSDDSRGRKLRSLNVAKQLKANGLGNEQNEEINPGNGKAIGQNKADDDSAKGKDKGITGKAIAGNNGRVNGKNYRAGNNKD